LGLCLTAIVRGRGLSAVTARSRRTAPLMTMSSNVLKSCRGTARASLRLSFVGEPGVMHARAKSTSSGKYCR